MKVEHPFIRTPFERLNNIFRNTTRAIEKEIASIIGDIRSLKEQESTHDALDLLNSSISKIKALKEKVFSSVFSNQPLK